jgi:multidrug transporter EmrE-like cation transporter
MKWLFPLALLVLFELIADMLAKSWSLQRKTILAIGALTAYCIGNSFWLFALKNGSGLARGATLFSVMTAVIAIVVGVAIFHESVNKAQWLGIVFGLVAIILLFWG